MNVWEPLRGGAIFRRVPVGLQRERFRGTVYRAANWQHIRATQVRTRQDRYSALHMPVKYIYVYPLAKNLRQVLTRGPA